MHVYPHGADDDAIVVLIAPLRCRCNTADTADFISDQMCCACGGGSTVNDPAAIKAKLLSRGKSASSAKVTLDKMSLERRAQAMALRAKKRAEGRRLQAMKAEGKARMKKRMKKQMKKRA